MFLFIKVLQKNQNLLFNGQLGISRINVVFKSGVEEQKCYCSK